MKWDKRVTGLLNRGCHLSTVGIRRRIVCATIQEHHAPMRTQREAIQVGLGSVWIAPTTALWYPHRNPNTESFQLWGHKGGRGKVNMEGSEERRGELTRHHHFHQQHDFLVLFACFDKTFEEESLKIFKHLRILSAHQFDVLILFRFGGWLRKRQKKNASRNMSPLLSAWKAQSQSSSFLDWLSTETHNLCVRHVPPYPIKYFHCVLF